MTIAEHLWLRSHAAQRNFLEIAAYNSAFMQTATLQALHMTLNAPAAFWSAMSRVGAAPAANAPAKPAAAKSAEIVQLVAPDAAPADKAQETPVTVAEPVAAPAASAAAPTPAPAEAPKAAEAPRTNVAPKPAEAPKAAEAPKTNVAPEPTDAPKAAVLDPNPLLLDEPRGGKPDDLSVLNGIGAKLQTALNEFGIYHFDQLAGLNEDGIAWLNAQQKGFAMTCERYDIVAQAKAKLA